MKARVYSRLSMTYIGRLKSLELISLGYSAWNVTLTSSTMEVSRVICAQLYTVNGLVVAKMLTGLNIYI